VSAQTITTSIQVPPQQEAMLVALCGIGLQAGTTVQAEGSRAEAHQRNGSASEPRHAC
jgi:hypothetical protein